MTKPFIHPFIHIDTTLKPSRYQFVIWGLAVVLVGGILTQLAIANMYQGLIGLVVIIGLWFTQISSYHLLACSTLPSSHSTANFHANHQRFDFLDWQLQLAHGVFLIPWQVPQDVWQAKLHTMTDMGSVMILYFDIVEPYQKRVSVTVWQDQLEQDTWRQLKILAR